MMLEGPGVLPFHINLPLFKVYGLLRLDTQVLVMEFQLLDRAFGLFRSGVRTLHLPFLALTGVELQKAWTGHRTLVLKASSLHPLRRVPGALQGHCWLRIQRQHREQAEIFYSALLLKLSEYQLERLNGMHDAAPLTLEPGWNAKFKRLLLKRAGD